MSGPGGNNNTAQAQGMTSGSPMSTQQQLQQQHGGPTRKPSNPFGQQRPVLQPPLSPAEQEIQNRRVTALLNINIELLRAASQLQHEGRGRYPVKPGATHGGQTSPITSEPGKEGEEGEKKQITSQEYFEYVVLTVSISCASNMFPLRCVRRVNVNLAYLAAVSERQYKEPEKIPQRPAILDTLPNIPGNTIPEPQLQLLSNLYKELREMYTAGSMKGAGPGPPLGPPLGLGPGQGPGPGGHVGGPPQQPQMGMNMGMGPGMGMGVNGGAPMMSPMGMNMAMNMNMGMGMGVGMNPNISMNPNMGNMSMGNMNMGNVNMANMGIGNMNMGTMPQQGPR